MRGEGTIYMEERLSSGKLNFKGNITVIGTCFCEYTQD